MTTSQFLPFALVEKGPLFNPMGINQWPGIYQVALPFLKRDVGRDGWEAVGKRFSVGNCSRIVHLAHLACKHEGITWCIMPSTGEEALALAIYCDEQTSWAGMLTRL